MKKIYKSSVLLFAVFMLGTGVMSCTPSGCGCPSYSKKIPKKTKMEKLAKHKALPAPAEIQKSTSFLSGKSHFK